MKHGMWRSVLWLSALAGAAAPTSLYARQSTDLAAILRAVGVGADALVSIRNGEVLAAQLPGTPSDEVGVFAVARVSTSADTFLARFGDLDVFRRRAATHAAGAVSSPPVAEEFSALPMPASDLAALAGCRVGSCSVKVPTAVLDSVQGRDAAAVNRIVQGMFLDLARRFNDGGAGALPAYADKVPPTTPAQGMSALLAGPTPLLSLFPDLRAELADASRPLPAARALLAVGVLWSARGDRAERHGGAAHRICRTSQPSS